MESGPPRGWVSPPVSIHVEISNTFDTVNLNNTTLIRTQFINSSDLFYIHTLAQTCRPSPRAARPLPINENWLGKQKRALTLYSAMARQELRAVAAGGTFEQTILFNVIRANISVQWHWGPRC